jgi:DNA-damage-inducible protein J
MKSHVVRARVEPELKAQASQVLASHGLDLSDGIRLFLRHVVARKGIPFAIRELQAPRVASARKLRRMKRASQKRDRSLAASGEFPDGEQFLIRPEDARAAKIDWPDGDL